MPSTHTRSLVFTPDDLWKNLENPILWYSCFICHILIGEVKIENRRFYDFDRKIDFLTKCPEKVILSRHLTFSTNSCTCKTPFWTYDIPPNGHFGPFWDPILDPPRPFQVAFLKEQAKGPGILESRTPERSWDYPKSHIFITFLSLFHIP